jgi:hypothetical protein
MSTGLSRREALRLGLGGAAGFAVSALLSRQAWAEAAAGAAKAAPARVLPAKAKSVIQIWLGGGPPHIDMFDPKPEAGRDYAGPTPLDRPIATNVDGIEIGRLLPLLAGQAHNYSLIRSMTHGENGHETAAYMVETGRKAGGRDVFPSSGAVVALFKGYSAGYEGLIPPYVVLTQPQGRFSEAGFLGPRYKPFATGGNPAAEQFVVEGFVAAGITRERQKARRELLHDLDALKIAMKDDRRIAALDQCEDKAYDLILGEAGNVFYLAKETPELRQAYGLNTFGQSCLAARRLVEYGVPYVTINSGGWDTHKEHFEAMRRLLPQVDMGLATLLADLEARNLLDTTIVWCCGEFGRTPKIDWGSPWNGGRGHWGSVFSVLVAGGGFKGGRIVGASDAKGERVLDRPVYPWDLLGSIYELAGIDPDGELPHSPPVRVTPSPEEGYNTGGRLREVM